MRPERTDHRGLLSWFAGNAVSANLLMFLMLAGGLAAALSIRVETFPEVDPGQIQVRVLYPGATPEDVELSITRRVEDAVLGIDGVERVRSTAAEGSGTTTVELRDFADPQSVRDDIESAVNLLAAFPPAEAERPSISIVEPGSVVLRLAVFGQLSELALREAAEGLESDLLQLPNISQVGLNGVRAREISIEVSEETLRTHGLSLQQVANAVDRASVDLSAGVLRTPGGEILLRTDAERRSGADFENIVVSSDRLGRRLTLRDVGTVRDGFEDGRLINTFQGQPAVFIDVEAAEDQDAFDVSASVLSLLSDYPTATGAMVAVVSDNTTLIRDRLNLLVRNGAMGLALVFVCLAFSLDLRLAFWTSTGILVSFLGAFAIIGQFTTINMMTLFGLIVVLGIVVDDAIVVGESIFEQQQRTNDGALAAIDGTIRVAAPILVGVLTSIAAFAPLLFSTGTIGQILFPVPVVVIAVLTMSLLEAFLVLPAHLSHGADWSRGAMARSKRSVQSFLERFRDDLVMPVARVAVRARYVTVGATFGLLVTTAGIVSSGRIQFVFFPAIEADEVSMTLEMADGTPFERTLSVMQLVEAAAVDAAGGAGNANVDSLSITVGALPSAGGGPPRDSSTNRLGSHLGGATMALTTPGHRTSSSADIERRWRDAVGDVPGAKSVSFTSTLVGSGADISLDLSHPDESVLFGVVEKLETELRSLTGVHEIETGLNHGKRQLEFVLTPAGDAAGLTTQDVARQVRQAFFGQEVQRVLRGRNEIRVFVRYPLDQRRSMTDLDRFRIRLADGSEAPLSVVAEIEESLSATSINRVDGRRVVSVQADVEENVANPDQVMEIITTKILPRLRAAFPKLTYSIEGQSRERRTDVSALAKSFLIALGIIYVMLASVLRSYLQPIVIMAAIPVGAMNAVVGHLILGYDLSFLSLFGMVALSGVIVNDSVVLIDNFNWERNRSGCTVEQAVISATRRRFRPILLTTVTTFLGLLPMLTETSLQAQFLIPMAISLGFGILLTGFMIFPLVPALLMIVSDAERRLALVFARNESAHSLAN